MSATDADLPATADCQTGVLGNLADVGMRHAGQAACAKAATAAWGTSHKKRVADSEKSSMASAPTLLLESMWHGIQVDPRAEAAGKCHFGQCHGQAPFAQDRGRRGPVRRAIAWCTRRERARWPWPASTRGTSPPAQPPTSAKCEPPSSSFVSPTTNSRLPGSFRSIVTHRAHVVDLAQRADQQRRRNGDALLLAGGVGIAKFVVQAVLAADEGRAQGDGQIVTGQRRADQRAERLRPIGVAPAEIVENGDPPRIGPDGHAVAQRLVDGARRPCGRCRNRRSADSCRRPRPRRAASRAPAARPPHRRGRRWPRRPAA